MSFTFSHHLMSLGQIERNAAKRNKNKSLGSGYEALQVPCVQRGEVGGSAVGRWIGARGARWEGWGWERWRGGRVREREMWRKGKLETEDSWRASCCSPTEGVSHVRGGAERSGWRGCWLWKACLTGKELGRLVGQQECTAASPNFTWGEQSGR